MESTEQRVREAATALFAAKGFHATSIRDIANASGITTASMYHYVRSKDDLLHAVMVDGLVRIIRAVDLIIDKVDHGPAGKLAGVVQLHVWVHGTRQLSARVTDTEIRALSGDAREEIVGLRDDYQRRWLDVIRKGVRAGDFHTADVHMAALAIIEMATGVSHWFSPKGELSLTEISEQFANMALAIVGSPMASKDGWLRPELRIEPTQFYPADTVATPPEPI